MEEFQKQETIENIKARVEAMKKNAVPPAYTPGNQEAGSTIKIGEILYRVVNQQGTIVRETEKEASKTQKHRALVTMEKSKANPNLTRRLDREDRINKIRMFNKAQKAFEKEMSRPPAVHVRTPVKPTMVEVTKTGSEGPSVETATVVPKPPVLKLDPRYVQYLAIVKKQKIKKAKKKKANKLAEQKRRHNNKFNKN